MMNIIHKLYLKILTWSLATSTLVLGCARYEQLGFPVDTPQSVVDQEVLNAYEDLQVYMDQTDQPYFRLGTELSLQDINNNTLLYRLALRNFNEVRIDTGFNHSAFIFEYRTLASGSFQLAMDKLSANELELYRGNLLWHRKMRGKYLRNLVADIVLPGESGTDIIADFESNEVGDTYPMSNGGSGLVVVETPVGESGKVLNITGAQTFPQFEVTLPGGRKLGDYTSVTLDFKGAGCCGFYGGGMRMGISSSTGPVSVTNYTDPSGFGIAENVWGRGRIILPLATMNLSASQRELTSFVLTVGSGTGSANYLIDNASIAFEIPGQTIVKTEAEKKAILREEMEKWIGSMVDIGKSHVHSWSLLYQPLSETAPYTLRSGANMSTIPDDHFYWFDYFGADYAVEAHRIYQAHGRDTDKLFITETSLLDAEKRGRLLEYMTYLTEEGTVLDGIEAPLRLNSNYDQTQVKTMLEALAATNKLVKVSVDIGTGSSTSLSTALQYGEQEAAYKSLIQVYHAAVPKAQRAGILVRSPIDKATNASWRSGEPVGIWNANFMRKPAFRGIVEALSGQ